MTEEFAVWVIREALFTALMVAGPMLLAGLVTGVTISLLQSVTQVQEMTLTFIPKILAVVTVLIMFSPWMAKVLISFFNMIVGHISQMAQ